MSLMAQTQKKKAQEYVAEADKVLSRKASSWLFGGGARQERQAEEAAELLMQAANAYKVGGWTQEAGDIYARAGAIYRDALKNPNEASKCFSQAGSCYKKSNPVDAVAAYQSAVTLLTDAGRLSQAAKLCKECAELYESEEVVLPGNAAADHEKNHVLQAIEYFDQAAQLFSMEDSKSQASQCLAKVAELCSAALEPPELVRASQIYDSLGRQCLESNLLKFNAKGYFLQAILCHLAAPDAIGAEQAMSKYEGLDYTFGDSREGKFAGQLVESVKNYDVEGLGTACYEYDRISKLDPWKTSMLVKVKRGLQAEAGGEEADDVDLT